jgi:hypothetical protein
MARLRTLAAAALVALAAAAPALASPAVPAGKDLVALAVTPERQAATEFAMVLALARSAVAQQCQQQQPSTQARAASALAGWRARNQALVQPLLSWVNYVAGIDAKDADEARRNVQLAIGGYKARATALARLELGSDAPDAAACNAALARFEDPARDLARSSHGPHLEAIRAYIAALQAPARPATK